MTRVTRTEYDALSRPVTTTLNYQMDQPVNTLPDVNVQSTRQYDAQGNVTWRRDALGRWTQTQYDALNRPVTTTVNYEDGNPTTVAPGDQNWTDGHDTDIIHVTRYNADGSTAGAIDNYVTGQFAASAPITDRVTQYGYNTLGRLVTTTVNLDTNPADAGRTDVNRMSVTAYNGLTQPVGQRDALGRWTATGYDALGRATTTTQNCADGGGTPVNPTVAVCASFNPGIPDRNVPSGTRYDALGRAFESVDALGHVTHSAYDGLGQTVAITQNYVVGGAVNSDTNVGTATTYDALGRVSGETDATGAATSDGYNALGQTVAVTDAVGRVTRTGYDGTGAERWSATPDGRLTVYLTDGVGRTVTTIQNYVTGVVTASTPADQDLTTRTIYDLGGRRTQTVDAARHVTADGYDLLDQQTFVQQNVQAICMTGATDCNVTTQDQYDRAGHRVAITDPNGHMRHFAFDAADEQTAATDALGRATTRAYDQGGRVTVQHDPRGTADDLSYSYDGLNRLAGTTAQNLPAPIHAQYDALGQRTSLSDATGTTAFSYDAVGRTTAITAPGTGTIGYGYDANGQRTGLTYPDGLTLGYTYDRAGELQRVTQGGVPLAGYSYDPAGRLQQVTRASGAVTTYGYNGADRLLDQRTTVTGVNQSEFQASVDRLGQRTVVTETVGLNPTTQDMAIDAGGAASGPFAADNGYSGGAISTTTRAIDTSGVVNPAPPAVYQSERTGSNFTYSVRNLTANGTYAVRLHVAEIDYTAAGQRQFNVAINNTQVLTNFDIAATAGAANTALVEAFSATADGGGNLYVQFTGVTGAASVGGIEVIFTTASGPAPHLALAAPTSRRTPARLRGAVPRTGRATSPTAATASDAGRTAALLTAYNGLPLHFEPNVGQTDKRVAFLARGRGYGLFLTGGDATLVLLRPRAPLTATAPLGAARSVSATVARAAMEETAVRLRLIGAHAATLVGQERLPGAANYFTGTTSGGWHSGIATYAAVSATAVYPGVDLVYHGTQGALEYDYHLAPGTAPGVIRLGIDGVRGVDLDGQGTLTLRTALGDLTQAAPAAYQDIAGRRQPIAVRYALTGPTTVGFVVGAYDHTRPLVIDPVLGYSTYLGGNGAESGNAIAVDHQGDAYLVGQTASTNYITTTNAYSPSLVNGNGDVFVTKLNPSGSAVVYSTYLGGSNADTGSGVAVDARGRAYVTGYTTSLDFPTTAGAVQRTGRGGGNDAFATALSEDGGALVYSTYLSGSSDDRGNALALDSQGDAYIAGQTSSSDYLTTTGALQPASHGGGYDAFVTKLSPGGALVYSTYFGGTGGDVATGVAVDGGGNAYLTGATTSADFPTIHAFQAVDHGNNEAFAAKLNVAGSALVYSTYLGGGSDDLGTAIAVDSQGSAYVTGRNNSGDFPTTNAYQPTNHGSFDVFVDKLTPGGDALAYGTFLGGGGDDFGDAIAVGNSGKAVVTGQAAVNFPVTANAPQFVYADGGIDAFVAEVDTTLSGTASLLYSTYLGGNGQDYGYGAALDCAGNAYVTGRTSSTTFITTTGGLQPGAGGGGNDAFAAKIGATRVITYAYDGVQRLTDAVECPGSTYHYGYDLASNRTLETVNGVVQQQVTYDAANQVITATTPQGTSAYGYDAAGNLLSDGASAYSYDALDRLTALAGAGTTEGYGYNGDGVLVTQTVNGTPTRYTQDLAAGQSQVLQTATGTGTPTVTDYLYGDGAERLASLPSGGTARTWYMPDLQGSVRYTTDDGANASLTVNYDPYGTPEGATPPTFGYDGELQDAATGLQNLRARTYNPATGQFLTRDPLEQQTGQAYLYASGDPVNGSDPSR